MRKNRVPTGFVVLATKIPELVIDLKYATDENLIGRPLAGYSVDGDALLTEEAAQSLRRVLKYLQSPVVKSQLNFTDPTLIIWDAFRPQRACEDFWAWSHTDCQKTKNAFYPNIEKRDLFKLGYIGRKSSHSRGSTVDLNIVDRMSGKALDMGTPFDYMDVLSHPNNTQVSKTVYDNRQFLKNIMKAFGWIGILEEWWHFTFSAEPFPDAYFDFPIINYKE